MKALTIRLGQFAICALVLTVLFRYALNLCIEANSVIGTTTCSIVYGGLMFLVGWYFGTKDAKENEVHDIGFRYHLVTYILILVDLKFHLLYLRNSFYHQKNFHFLLQP